MTRITKAITRETSALDPVRNLPIVVTLHEDGKTLTLRTKGGRREQLKISWVDVYRLAYQTAVHAAREAV